MTRTADPETIAMSVSVTVLLRELHRLRRHIRDLQAEIDLGPRVMGDQEATLEAERRSHAESADAIKKLKLKQKDDEGALKTVELQIEKYKGQLNSAGSKKEFDAKESEIKQASAKKGDFEDAILTTIAELEERTANIPAVEKQWVAAKAAFEQFKTDAQDRLVRMQADLKAANEQLAITEPKLPPDVRAAYDRMVKGYGPDGLAAVVGRACQQCRTNLTEQQRNDLVRGSMFVTCPRCGRGLYLAEAA